MNSAWALPHIHEEVQESLAIALQPSVANLDALTSIPLVAVVLGIGASTQHPVPDVVKWGLGTTVRTLHVLLELLVQPATDRADLASYI